MNNRNVAHRWYHSRGMEKSSSSKRNNLFFTGDTIYSYGSHFAIARHVTNKSGEHAVFFTSRDYSVSTARHKRYTHSAIPQDAVVFYVYSPEASVETSWRALKEDAAELRAHLDNAKSRKERVSLWRAYRKATGDLIRFAKFFGIRYLPDMPEESAMWERMTREEDAKEEARQEARDAARDAKYERQRIAREEARAKRASELPEIVSRWRNGGSISYSDAYELPTMLRIRGDMVESSHGADFPVSHAVRALPVIEKLYRDLDNNGCIVNPEAYGLRFGLYRINAVENNGTIRAGCHTIAREEIMRLVETLRQSTAVV